MKTENIEIFPIFNQVAPNVWDDMLRVRVAAMRHNYRVDLQQSDLKNARTELINSWSSWAHNFAFGAYDGGQLVGCLNGDCRAGVATIQHLYVLPEYQGYKLGSRLLSAAEVAMSIHARRTELVALGFAYKFYERNGYSAPMGDNKYVKSLRRTGFACAVPLFHCSPAIRRMGEGFACQNEFNVADVNKQHCPAWAFRDADARILGVGLISPSDNQQTIVMSNVPEATLARRILGSAMNRYMGRIER